MKKLTFIVSMAFIAMLFTSCKPDYDDLVGTWGVERIEYYNIDYWGNPIEPYTGRYDYDPNSTDNGIQMIFRGDKTGEIRDSAIDTIWLWNEDTGGYDTYIACSDTVLVTTFTCSFDKSEQVVYMNTSDSPRPYRMTVSELTKNTLVYENEYGTDYVEKAYLKRVSKKPTKSAERSSDPVKHPHRMQGTIFGNK